MSDARAVPPASVDAARPLKPVLSLCPSCSRPDVRRSHVRFYERPMKWLTASRPYRCGSCQARFWGRMRPDHAPLLTGPTAGRHEPADPIAAPSLDLAEIDRALDRDRITLN